MPKSPLTPVRLSLGGGGASCIASSAAARTRAELSHEETAPSQDDSPRVWHEHATSPSGYRPTSPSGARRQGLWRHCSCQTALHEVRAMLNEAAAQCDTLKSQLKETRRREREQAEAPPATRHPPSATTRHPPPATARLHHLHHLHHLLHLHLRGTAPSEPPGPG